MTSIRIEVPGVGPLEGEGPIVILGPNGCGKTQLAKKISQSNQVNAISAQRRTWVDDNLPVQEEQHLHSNVRSQIDRWRQHSWQPTEEINFVLSALIQDHTRRLTKRNAEAIESDTPFEAVKDTKLIRLQSLWSILFPQRRLEIDGFFPKVSRLDASNPTLPYSLREMSDGERTVLYMAARVMTADQTIILVDEPELHMHSKLAVKFWDEAEDLRPDCRFVYVTHDLNFALSRRSATVLIARSNESAKAIPVDQLPSTVATEVLGAATLPFYAKRIFLFEGELGKFASEFFSSWFDGPETFAIPTGNRDAVCAALTGLKSVGITGAEVIGLVDRDFYPQEALDETTSGVTVLPLHEIESVLCDQNVIAAIANHFGKDVTEISNEFLGRVRKEFQGQTFSSIVTKRVRARVGDLLDGAFAGGQIDADVTSTGENHRAALSGLGLPAKTVAMFAEETSRVQTALNQGGKEMLAILPGKHLLSLLAKVLGFGSVADYTNLVVRSLDRKRLGKDDPLVALGAKIEAALLSYLPARRV